MAGQGETCSHIASVLFYIETFNRIRRKLACTDKQCEWILPTYSKDIPFAEVQDTDFRSATKLKQNDGIVNLYGSLYQNIISKEVEDQAINLVGADSFVRLNVVPIQ